MGEGFRHLGFCVLFTPIVARIFRATTELTQTPSRFTQSENWMT